jgi:hypothetical protein
LEILAYIQTSDNSRLKQTGESYRKLGVGAITWTSLGQYAFFKGSLKHLVLSTIHNTGNGRVQITVVHLEVFDGKAQGLHIAQARSSLVTTISTQETYVFALSTGGPLANPYHHFIAIIYKGWAPVS